MKEHNKYWERVQADICANCVDRKGEAECGLTGDVECGLQRFFPGIVDSVLSVQSENFAPYVAALREKVCASCDQQLEDGDCQARARVDCGLDRYLPMIIDSIESFKTELNGTSTEYPRAS